MMKKMLYLSVLLMLTLMGCSQNGNSAPDNAVPEQAVPEAEAPDEGNPGPQDMGNDGPVTGKTLKIGLFADPQYADVDDRGPRHYRSPLRKLPECIATFNQEKVDMVVCLGDIVDRNPAELDVLLPLLAKSEAPVHYVLGNHDFSKLKDVEGHIGKLGMPSLYYTLKLGGWKFIFLDTNDISRYAPMDAGKEAEFTAMLEKIKKEGTPNGENWNGGVGRTQMKWLENQLDAAKAAGEKVIVFGHHPLSPMSNHTLLNVHEVLGLLNSYGCVKAYLNGHYHPGAYEVVDGLPCCTLEAMLEGGERNSYAIMTLEDHRISLKGYGRVGDHVYEIR